MTMTSFTMLQVNSALFTNQQEDNANKSVNSPSSNCCNGMQQGMRDVTESIQSAVCRQWQSHDLICSIAAMIHNKQC